MSTQTTTAPVLQGPIKKVIATSAEGYPLLGFCAYWTFTKMKMAYSEFQQLLQDAGLPLDLAPETKRKSAVIRAAEEIVASTDRKSKFRRRPIDDQQSMVITIVHEHLDVVAQGTTYTTETKIVLHKESGNVTVHGTPEMKTLVDSLVAEYEKSYTTDQIRASLLSYLKDGDGCGGLMVRDSGGLYFVPATKQAEFDKLRKVFTELQKRAAVSVDVIPVIDTKEAAASMWSVLVGDVKGELSKLKEDIVGLRSNPSQHSQEIRYTKIQELSTKIQMYSTLLNGTAEELEGELLEIEQLFVTKLTANQIKPSQGEN